MLFPRARPVHAPAAALDGTPQPPSPQYTPGFSVSSMLAEGAPPSRRLKRSYDSLPSSLRLLGQPNASVYSISCCIFRNITFSIPLRLRQPGGQVMERVVKCLLVLLCSTSATAQIDLHSTKLELHSSEVTAPSWMTWRAFHASMVAYSESAPDDVKNLLVARTGLEPSAVDLLLSQGLAYLADLEQIDVNLRRDIDARRSTFSPRNPERRGNVSSVQPKRIDVTQLVRESAQADGTMERVERDRQNALKAHLESLAKSLGYGALFQVSSFVGTQVAPNVVILEVPRPAPPSVWAEKLQRELP